MIDFHEALTKNQKVRVKKVVLTSKSNSLQIGNLANPASVDEFSLSCEFVAITPLYTFGFRVTIEDEVFDPGDIKPMVVDDEGTTVGVTTLPMSADFFGGTVIDNNVLVFFHKPLRDFIKRKGSINRCATRFARRLGRSKSKAC